MNRLSLLLLGTLSLASACGTSAHAPSADSSEAKDDSAIANPCSPNVWWCPGLVDPRTGGSCWDQDQGFGRCGMKSRGVFNAGQIPGWRTTIAPPTSAGGTPNPLRTIAPPTSTGGSSNPLRTIAPPTSNATSYAPTGQVRWIRWSDGVMSTAAVYSRNGELYVYQNDGQVDRYMPFSNIVLRDGRTGVVQ
jgi:hypothetical protein